ncbi:DNA-packaging protein [Providencia stuartii]|nr:MULTISPECIES: DNA-packaging protein [Providencia]MBQ0458628.1 DNA-packaging protein [Providencia stuartii]QPN39464.1 DNA-packaging protein [Providencia sp. 2.29]WAZ79854.1 DNA-packaging protein [Providencia stuartii]WAZ82921.1 DNA-packaging protein [Providencia stuartii]
MATKTKMGRPSKFAESLVKAKEYLMGGYETVGDVVPSVAGLACYLGVSRSTVQQYAKENEDFSGTLESIKTLQENRLINKGLIGEFNPTITKLMLANHGYSEKQEVDHKSSDSSMSPTKIVLVAGGSNDGSED